MATFGDGNAMWLSQLLRCFVHSILMYEYATLQHTVQCGHQKPSLAHNQHLLIDTKATLHCTVQGSYQEVMVTFPYVHICLT